jgi:hypothetical protein
MLFGGGALAMRYGARDETKDLDVIFQDSEKELLVKAVAEIGTNHDIEKDWMNDEGKGNVTKEILENSTVFIELPGLTVLAPSAEAMLAMKVCSMRTTDDSPDINDIKFLIKETSIKTVDEVLDITEKFRPDYFRYLTPKHQYMISQLIEET